MSTMRPGQLASDCFNNNNQPREFKKNSGTPLELLEEWNELTKNLALSFSEDPESNLYVLKLSKALLIHLFKKHDVKKLQEV